MQYFKVLGLVFGSLALFKPLYMHVIPWDEMGFLRRAYSTKRPAWVVAAALAGFALVGLTWYRHLNDNVDHSIYITLLFSLSVVKASALLFNYRAFQRWVEALLERKQGRAIVAVDIVTGIFGAAVIALTLWLY